MKTAICGSRFTVPYKNGLYIAGRLTKLYSHFRHRKIKKYREAELLTQ